MSRGDKINGSHVRGNEKKRETKKMKEKRDDQRQSLIYRLKMYVFIKINIDYSIRKMNK